MTTQASYKTQFHAIVAASILWFALSANGQISPIPTPTPTPAASPTMTPGRVETVQELQSKIRMRLSRPELRRGHIGIKVVSLNTGKVVFEDNSEKYFMPASNMKNFTVATAIEKLTPDFKFVTSVVASTPPGPDGVIAGDLRIFGRGDVSISAAFNDGDHFKGLDRLADKIVAAGVRQVNGDLIGDESYFTGNAIPFTWEWDDLQWYYGAEISALPINDNAVDLTVLPGPSGFPCTVRLAPVNVVFQVVNTCRTVAGAKRDLRVEKKLGQNIIEVSGSLPPGDSGFREPITVSKPADLFITMLKDRLALKGVTVKGRARSSNGSFSATPSVEIARLESPPLNVIAARTMKPSQNMYTETILWTLGEQFRNSLRPTTASGSPVVSPAESSVLGRMVVDNFLKEIGVAEGSIVMFDGSGLSRSNLVTPSAVVSLYVHMAKRSKYSMAWRDALTVAGIDGTLRNRMTGTRAVGNVRGKTGTIRQVSALSGYLTTAGGEPLVFSIMVNGIPETRLQRPLIDEIVLNLVNFSGKID